LSKLFLFLLKRKHANCISNHFANEKGIGILLGIILKQKQEKLCFNGTENTRNFVLNHFMKPKGNLNLLRNRCFTQSQLTLVSTKPKIG
jgi:hypothetical protein